MSDGMVSSLAAVDDFYYINQVVPKTSSLRFDHVWMQTRDPRDTIPSIAKALRINFWRWQEKHTGIPGDLEPALLRAMLYWSAWIPLAMAQKPEWTYKLESIATAWPEMLGRLGVSGDLIEKAPGVYSSGAKRISWEEMESIDKAACDGVRKVAYELGYE